MTTKERKDDVNYSVGMMNRHCGPTFRDDHYFCKSFIPGTGWQGKCRKVEGEIEPLMWCRLYHRVRMAANDA